MSRKRNPYIPLFTHDIMSSAKCRRLSMRATGLYLWLLCLMNERPQQGRWALSTNEDHPTWKNSLTYRAMQNPDKYGRLPMFATLMARQFLPWKSGQVLKALQELYRFKLIVIEDDAIIQPRMYADNGFKLREDTMREYLADDPNDPNDDPEKDLAEAYAEQLKADGKKGKNKGTVKGTKKSTEKVHEIHAGAHSIEFESENNNNDSKGNIGGVGENAAVEGEHCGDGKTHDAPTDDGFGDFWQQYDKHYGGGSRIAVGSVKDAWESLSVEERQTAMAFVPQYVAATPMKQFRMHPRNFLEQRAWLTIHIDDGMARNKKAEPQNPAPTSQQRFTPPTQEEVTAYCQEKGYTFDPIQFWNHYEANGWVQGRNKPIRKWQACCVTWQQRENNGEFRTYNNNSNAERTTRHQQSYQGQQADARDRDIIEQSQRIIERKLRKNDGDTQ